MDMRSRASICSTVSFDSDWNVAHMTPARAPHHRDAGAAAAHRRALHVQEAAEADGGRVRVHAAAHALRAAARAAVA